MKRVNYLVLHALDVVVDNTEVGSTESTDWIPSGGSVVSETLAASILSASSATTNDIVEGVGHFSGDLVEEWVDQSQSWFALLSLRLLSWEMRPAIRGQLAEVPPTNWTAPF